MESPYRPPQEIEAADYSAFPGVAGEFRLAPDEQRMVGKLAKYLSDIGLMLIVVSVLFGFVLVFLTLTPFATGVAGMPGQVAWVMVLQLSQQLINVVFLFAIGLCMRRAAKPLRTAASAADDHMLSVMSSMLHLRTVYGWQSIYIGLGILVTLATLTFGFPF